MAGSRGYKRFQSSSRATVPMLERDGDKIKVNPLALRTRADIAAYFNPHGLPRQPAGGKRLSLD